MVEKEVRVNSRGILLNPTTGRDIELLVVKKAYKDSEATIMEIMLQVKNITSLEITQHCQE